MEKMDESMEEAGFEIIGEGYRNQWNPDEESKKQAIEFGKQIAKA